MPAFALGDAVPMSGKHRYAWTGAGRRCRIEPSGVRAALGYQFGHALGYAGTGGAGIIG